jgi:transcriptional regulator with XRE-family HTH domain
MQSLPDWLRSLRTHAGLTQAQLATRLGVARATLNRWENGRTYPDREDRMRLNDLAREAGHDPIVPRWRMG